MRRERGMATVAAMGVIVIIAGISAVLVVVADLSAAAQRAGRAADAAALAASSASLAGEDPCAAARVIARDNDATIVTCRMDADVATVTARAASSTPWGRWGAEQKARAAPLSYLD